MESTYSHDVLMSLKQCPTPLNTLFFSEYNQALLQKGIRQEIFTEYQKKIDYQNKSDLLALMRQVFVTNSSNPYGDLCAQVKFMNQMVIKEAVKQISTGLSQYLGYMRDIDSPIDPSPIPINTSLYGVKLDYNNKIGF